VSNAALEIALGLYSRQPLSVALAKMFQSTSSGANFTEEIARMYHLTPISKKKVT
jgi:hypothetical protein